MADYQIRHSESQAAREIKASAHYAYVVNGITLDGSKFSAEELVLEGQCLARNISTGKYEKYADGNAEAAQITGENTITPADLSGVDSGTYVTIEVNRRTFTIAASDLQTISGASTVADVITLVKGATDPGGNLLTTVAEVKNDGNDKLQITALTAGVGISVTLTIAEGVAGDQAAVEGVLGMASGTTDEGAGEWPEGYDNPVILDESVKFKLDDDGNNADQVAGQVLVHGAVYESMLFNCTDAFKARLAGAIRFV